jgi:hypothetical protein
MYNLRTDDSYGDVLQKDGKDCFCPFQAGLPIPVQTAMGGVGMNIMRMPCSSLCPHVKTIEHIGKNYYEISCSGKVEKFEIDEAKKGLSLV